MDQHPVDALEVFEACKTAKMTFSRNTYTQLMSAIIQVSPGHANFSGAVFRLDTARVQSRAFVFAMQSRGLSCMLVLGLWAAAAVIANRFVFGNSSKGIINMRLLQAVEHLILCAFPVFLGSPSFIGMGIVAMFVTSEGWFPHQWDWKVTGFFKGD